MAAAAWHRLEPGGEPAHAEQDIRVGGRPEPAARSPPLRRSSRPTGADAVAGLDPLGGVVANLIRQATAGRSLWDWGTSTRFTKRCSTEQRIRLLVRAVSASPGDLSALHLLRSVDALEEQAFRTAMRDCIARDNHNRLALQALVCASPRAGWAEKARACILWLLAINPDHQTLLLDLLRSEMMWPGPDAEAHIDDCLGRIHDGTCWPMPCRTVSNWTSCQQRCAIDVTRLSYDLATTGCLILSLCAIMSAGSIGLYGFDFYKDKSKPRYVSGHDQPFLGRDVAYERFFVGDVIPTIA